MRNLGLMAPLLLGACAPAQKDLPSTHPVAVEIVTLGAESSSKCKGNMNGLGDLADERTRSLLNSGRIDSSMDDLSNWECTPVQNGGVVTKFETSFRDTNGTVWVVDMTPPTDKAEGLSASLK